MNIILINHYAGSDYYGMEFRPYYMAKEWVKEGHNVTIIGADFSHLRKVNPKIKKDFECEDIDGINYLWVKTPQYNGNGIGRIANILTFINKLKLKAQFIADKYKPDAVIASSTYPLDIYPADKIAKIAKAKLIFEIHDIWPLTPMEIGGYSENNPLIKYLQKAEDYAYRNADTVVSILPDANKHIINRGFDDDNYVFVPNGVIIKQEEVNSDFEEVEQIRILKELKAKGNFLVGYTGNHSQANALDIMLEAAKNTKDDCIKYILVGNGNYKEQLIKYAQENNLNNVMFLDPVKKECISEVLKTLDVAYMSLKKEKLFRFGVSPNKLFDYMMASKPIIYSVEASNDPVKEAQCGITIPAENSQATIEAVLKLKNMSIDERNEMGNNGRKFVELNHEYKVLADKFLEALK